MKKISCFLLSTLLLVLPLFGTGCAPALTKFTDYSFDYFDTVTTIVGFEPSQEKFDTHCDSIKALLGEYHRLYTIYNRYEGVNNLCVVNSSAGESVQVDEKILDMLTYAKDMYRLTNGRVNVAMGSVLSVWHQYREEGLNDPTAATLPPADVLQAAAEHTDIDDVIVDRENGTVRLADPHMKLDVGAIAKGYAVEQVALWMQEQGMNGYILNVGGNVRIVGERQDGEAWTVGIENPDTANTQTPYIAYLKLGEMSLVTSGSYQRYYTVNGKNYHHIIDPETLMPAENFQSVSVLCKSSAQADALSTALFCMTYGEGNKLIETLSDTEAMWVLPNGEQRYSAGFKDYCEE
ncbi:MAG: FAD:protein FMN transferase [Clostridia bacterium]|nr:FAD:protein FMN transferase [Clostridia bacterium]